MTESTDFKALIGRVASGAALSVNESRAAFDAMMAGEATPSQMGGFLMALRVRGETVDEITGGAQAMRARALKIDAPEGTIDTCGTGGDAKGTFNISTAAALVAAGCGVPVAKHGNRALSSRSGSADLLAALGVTIDADMALVRDALWEAGIGFLMAPRHHGAMRHVGPTRIELGTRTVFNLLGPLANPAGAARQLIGVFDPKWATPMAEVLRNLGSECVWVVHGSDGTDELTTTGPSAVVELDAGTIRRFEVTPEDAGLPRAQPEDLKGGDAGENAAIVRAVLDGAPGPARDIVLLNSRCGAHRRRAGRRSHGRRSPCGRGGRQRQGPGRARPARRDQRPERARAGRERSGPMSDVLSKICDDKRLHVAARKRAVSQAALAERARAAEAPRGFAAALGAVADSGRPALIAELKRASPSKGLIRSDFDPPALAAAYARGGAACLSVLTDKPYFQGEDRYLSEAREAVSLPVLRKDFMLDPYQVVEARALGADCILLIMAALGDGEAAELAAAAWELGMDTLVEVHDAHELERGLALDASLLGINNRNLKTLEVDLATTERLAPLAAGGPPIVCESGLHGPADIARMTALGVRRFLVGEALMRQADVAAATSALLAPVSGDAPAAQAAEG